MPEYLIRKNNIYIYLLLFSNAFVLPIQDFIESIVGGEEDIKGIWCVPKYSNPGGITYSNEVVVKRFIDIDSKAQDFRISWDNAYAVHYLTDKQKSWQIYSKSTEDPEMQTGCIFYLDLKARRKI